MGLYERLLHIQEPGLSGHAVSGLVYEVASGAQTAATAKSALGLSAAESTEFDQLIATVTGSLAAKAQRVAEIHFVLLVAETRVMYGTVATVKTRLGV